MDLGGSEAVLDGSLSAPGERDKGPDEYTSVISSAAASITGSKNPKSGYQAHSL